LAGHRVFAIDLPGHGLLARYPASYFSAEQAGFETEVSPLSDVTLDVAAEAVITVLRQAQSSVKPILVGHSLGGAVITRAAELAPQCVGRLVYVAAFLPTDPQSPAALYELPEARTPHEANLTVGDAAGIGAVRFNPRGSIDYLRRLQAVFYQDIAVEQFLPRAAAMSPDLPLGLWGGEPTPTAARWGRLGRTYIHCTLDCAIAPALQRLMVASADRLTPSNPTAVREMTSGHSPFASQPERLSEILGEVAYPA